MKQRSFIPVPRRNVITAFEMAAMVKAVFTVRSMAEIDAIIAAANRTTQDYGVTRDVFEARLNSVRALFGHCMIPDEDRT